MSVWTLGINHHTAPLDLRGRFAFALDQIQPTLHGYRQSLARQPEATLLSTCNRTELYGAGDAVRRGPHAGLAGPDRWREHPRAARPRLRAARRPGGAPRLPRGQRAGQHGAGRSADPGPDERRGARRQRRRRPGQHAAPAVPALVCGGQGGAQLHRDRRPLHQHDRRGRAPGRAAVRRPERHPRAVRRRGRDDRTRRHPLRGQNAQEHGDRQPHAGARRKAGRPLRRRGHAPGRHARPPARVRRRHQLHRQHPAHHRPGRRGARAEEAPPPPHVHGRSGRAARHRTRSQGPDRRLPLHGGRSGQRGANRQRQPPGRRGPGRGHHRRRVS